MPLCGCALAARLQANMEANDCPQRNDGPYWVQLHDHCYAFNMSFYNYSVYRMQQAQTICQSMSELFLGVLKVIIRIHLKQL